MIKKTLLILLQATLSIGLWAQNSKADSLAQLLQPVKDTQRVNILNELSKSLWYYKLDKADEYNKEALQLADNLNYEKGLAEANRCRGVILSFRFDSSGMTYLNKALELFKKLGNKRGVAATLNNQNVFYSQQGQYSKALDVLTQSLKLFTELQDKEAVGAVTNQIGNIYRSQYDYSAALDFYLKALAIRKEIGDTPGTAFSLNRVGDMYFQLNQFSKSLDYYQQAYALAKTTSRNQNIHDAASSIGDVYLKTGEYNEAVRYFEIALKAEENYFGKDSVIFSYIKLGQAHMYVKNFEQALLNFQKALVNAQQKGAYERASILRYIGQVYFAKKDYKNALDNCQQSLAIASPKKMIDIISECSLTLSEIYAAQKDFPRAYEYHAQYASTKDSLSVKDLNQRLASLQQSFELKNKQNEIDRLNTDKQLQQSEISRQKQQRYGFIAGFILFIMLVIILARSNRHKQKSNSLLTKQKEEIQRTLSELKSTQAQLIQSEKMASLGQLTAGIAHEIQNPLNFVNNFSEINKELLSELKDEAGKGNIEEVNAIINDVMENSEKINHHGKRADAIVKGMLQHSRTSTGQKELTDINALADEYLRLSYQGLRAKDKSFNATIKTDFDNSIGKVSIVPQDIGRMLINLYNNAFYAVNEKKKQKQNGYEPTVTVSTKKNAGNILISVKDNGIGIPQNIVDKIFQPFFTTKPTGQGTGLGLSLSYDIVKAHGGDLKVEDSFAGDEPKAGQEEAGSGFIVQLPLA